MCITTTGGIASFVPEIQVTDLSYAIPGETRVSTLLCESSLADAIRDEVLKKVPNVRMMGMSESAVRSFITTGKEIRTAADLKGIKMRTINSPLQMELVKVLGGNPTPVSWGEVYTSLETGVIGGIKNNIPTSLQAKLVPPLKYIIIDQHSVAYKYCWVSDKWLKSMPEDLQNIVAEAVREAAMFMTHFCHNQLSYAREKFAKDGGTIYYPTKEEKATFLKAKPIMRDWFINKYKDGERWVKIQENAIAEVEAKISAENKAWTK